MDCNHQCYGLALERVRRSAFTVDNCVDDLTRPWVLCACCCRNVCIVSTPTAYKTTSRPRYDWPLAVHQHGAAAARANSLHSFPPATRRMITATYAGSKAWARSPASRSPAVVTCSTTTAPRRSWHALPHPHTPHHGTSAHCTFTTDRGLAHSRDLLCLHGLPTLQRPHGSSSQHGRAYPSAMMDFFDACDIRLRHTGPSLAP